MYYLKLCFVAQILNTCKEISTFVNYELYCVNVTKSALPFDFLENISKGNDVNSNVCS